MSLDVYLYWPESKEAYCVHCGSTYTKQRVLYESNITHNLAAMAEEAGIYKHLWRPDEIGITTAAQLIEPLTEGLDKLKCFPERFKPHNPPNGWGTYEGFVEWVRDYLEACKEMPEAIVQVSR